MAEAGRQGGRGKRAHTKRKSSELKAQMGALAYYAHVHTLVEEHLRKASALREFKDEFAQKHGRLPWFEELPQRVQQLELEYLSMWHEICELE